MTITGGACPGTYELTVARGGCSARGRHWCTGSFGTQVSDIKVGPTALGSVQLIIPKVVAAGSAQLQMIVRIGSLMKMTAEYNINTLPNAKATGKGTVSVKDAGATATVSFDATTADGVHLVGTVDCKSVTRM